MARQHGRGVSGAGAAARGERAAGGCAHLRLLRSGGAHADELTVLERRGSRGRKRVIFELLICGLGLFAEEKRGVPPSAIATPPPRPPRRTGPGAPPIF